MLAGDVHVSVGRLLPTSRACRLDDFQPLFPMLANCLPHSAPTRRELLRPFAYC